MESFEHLCKVALEAERFVVTGNVKFIVRRKTQKKAHAEYQEHGYEIDLVAARGDQLVLAEVKSYFGSRGVNRQGFRQLADETRRTHYDRFKLFNDSELRAEVCALACEQYGYESDRLKLRMYVGNFARGHEQAVREHLANLRPIPVQVVGLGEIVPAIIGLAGKRTYTDDPVVMTVKALAAAGRLTGATSKVTL
jgi:Holliday junction resolvase-like predicted endonuclease